MLYLLNAFSFNMVEEFPVAVTATETSVENAAEILAAHHLEIESGEASDGGISNTVCTAVGHADTASVFSSVLGLNVPSRRETVVLKKGDRAVVGQYSGPRLPEGATSLPEGAVIKWLLVEVN